MADNQRRRRPNNGVTNPNRPGVDRANNPNNGGRGFRARRETRAGRTDTVNNALIEGLTRLMGERDARNERVREDRVATTEQQEAEAVEAMRLHEATVERELTLTKDEQQFQFEWNKKLNRQDFWRTSFITVVMVMAMGYMSGLTLQVALLWIAVLTPISCLVKYVFNASQKNTVGYRLEEFIEDFHSIDVRKDAMAMDKIKHWNPRYVTSVYYSKEWPINEEIAREKISLELFYQITTPNNLPLFSEKKIAFERLFHTARQCMTINISKSSAVELGTDVIGATVQFAYGYWLHLEERRRECPFPEDYLTQ
jgi:hypothetical protein